MAEFTGSGDRQDYPIAETAENLTTETEKMTNPQTQEEKISFWHLFMRHKSSVLVDCLVFGIFGMGVAFLGPTLFDLGCQTKSDLKKMNWVFFVQLLMTMIGSVSAGCLTGRFVPANILLVVGMTGLPVTMFLIPVCTGLAGLLVNLMIMGWFMGCVDCVANLRMILRFGTNVTPFLQALHFFYGLGAFISPMIASPFLLNIDCTPFIDGYTVEPPGHATANHSVTMAPQPRVVNKAIRLSHSKEAFIILGSIQLVIAIVVYCVICLERKWYGATSSGASSLHGSNVNLTEDAKDGQGFSEYSGNRFLTRCLRCGTKEIVIITCLTSASLFIYDGLQSSFADYIYSYAEKNTKDLDRKEGATLNSVFWGPFALGRLLAIGLSTKLSAPFMLVCNMTGCGFAMLLSVIWQTSRVVIYISTCAFGLFLSSMSPTVMGLTEQFIDINAPITSCMVVFAALGESICPVIVGNLFVSIGPVSFLAFCFTLVLVALVLFVILYMVGRDTYKFRETIGSSFVWLATQKHGSLGENMQIIPSAVKYYSNAAEGDAQDSGRVTSSDPMTTQNGGGSTMTGTNSWEGHR